MTKKKKVIAKPTVETKISREKDKFSPMKGKPAKNGDLVRVVFINNDDKKISNLILDCVKKGTMDREEAYKMCEKNGELWYDTARKIERIPVKK